MSVVSLMFSSGGYINGTQSEKFQLFKLSTSSIYLKVKLNNLDSLIFLIMTRVWSPSSGTGYSRCIEDPLMASGCYLLFGRVVVSLTYSPFPFSMLFVDYRVWLSLWYLSPFFTKHTIPRGRSNSLVNSDHFQLGGGCGIFSLH